MGAGLQVALGQYSDRGRKAENQDFYGACLPKMPVLQSKGLALAIADGISSSPVSQMAAQSAVTGFLEDYYCTPEAWSVHKAGEQVLRASNSWLYAQTQQSQHRYERDRGYVCTFSALVLKSTTAHVFHIGDARIYLLRAGQWQQLTQDHRVWVSSQQSYLARALGMDSKVEVDYLALPLQAQDVLLLATDGVYDYLDWQAVQGMMEAHTDLDAAAKALAEAALQRGSPDNLSIQLLRVEQLPQPEANELYQQVLALPCPPVLQARQEFEGYQILQVLKNGSRSHAYLALDPDTGERVWLKTPAQEIHDQPAALERFLLEEWIARRINNPHVAKPCTLQRPRHAIYVAMEYIEGQTLAQWLLDHPRPDLPTVRHILRQIAKGLQAFHRLEMVYQDLKPANVMIDGSGTVKLIDFGACRVAGLEEISSPIAQLNLLGDTLYAAPEYLLGEPGSSRADIYAFGVLAYHMLTAEFPYGSKMAQTRSRAAQKKLIYRSAQSEQREIPRWVDEAIAKAVHINPLERYAELSELMMDLERPNPAFMARSRPPLLERNPVAFWRGLSFVLAVLLLLSIFGWGLRG